MRYWRTVTCAAGSLEGLCDMCTHSFSCPIVVCRLGPCSRFLTRGVRARRGVLPGALPVCMRHTGCVGVEAAGLRKLSLRVAAEGQHRGRMVAFFVHYVFCSDAHLHTASTGAAARGALGRALRPSLHLRSRAAVACCALPRGSLVVPKEKITALSGHSCPLRLAHAFQAVGSCTCNIDGAGRGVCGTFL